ncbi:hypothetical protein D3C73_1393720 [compost metagenome]
MYTDLLRANIVLLQCRRKRRFRRLRWSGKVRLPVEGRTRILALDQAEVCSTEGPAVHRAEARFHVTGATAAVPAYLIRRVNLIVSPKHVAVQVKSADEVDDNG